MEYGVLEKPQEWIPAFAETALDLPLQLIAGAGPPERLFEPQKRMAEAIAFHQKGDLAAAQELYGSVIRSDPNHADALHLSGIIAYQIGKYSIAISMIIRAIRNQPQIPQYHANLGTVFQAAEQYEKAAKCYQKAIHINPDYVEAYYNMGNLMSVQERYETAIQWYRQTLLIAPDYLDALYNLANCYKKLESYPQAIEHYGLVIQLNPGHIDSYNNMGNSLLAMNRKPEAVDCYRRALDIAPDSPEVLYNLAQAYQFQGKIAEAVSLYQRAIALKADDASAYNNIGNIFKDLGRVTDAVLCYRKALTIDAEFLIALNNMGNCFKETGEISKAVRCYRTVLDAKPDCIDVHSNLLYSLNFQAGHRGSWLARQHRAWAEQHLSAVKRIQPAATCKPAQGRRLRIGYVSPDFREHPVGRFIAPLIAGHDRSAFTIYCYADVPNPEPVTEAIRRSADFWRDITGRSDQEVAEQVRQDGIDILVDLAGHTANNRLAMFARKPAPVQVSYLGYPNTSGVPAIDYRITDVWSDPPGVTDHLYTEKLVHLPSCFLCFSPGLPDPAAPENIDRGSDVIRFGSFNQPAKMTAEVTRVWAEILTRIPHAELILKAKPYCDADVRARTRERFAAHGVRPERLHLIGHQDDIHDHLYAYREMDIGLDPFPYNGTTTTCEALWMGVPVIVLAGRTHVSRVGVSLLRNIGRKELIADSPAAYIEKAVALANDRERVRKYQIELRSDMQHSALMDKEMFCREFESALQDIWKTGPASPAI